MFTSEFMITVTWSWKGVGPKWWNGKVARNGISHFKWNSTVWGICLFCILCSTVEEAFRQILLIQVSFFLQQGNFKATLRKNLIISYEQMVDNLASHYYQVVDTRPADQFKGNNEGSWKKYNASYWHLCPKSSCGFCGKIFHCSLLACNGICTKELDLYCSCLAIFQY